MQLHNLPLACMTKEIATLIGGTIGSRKEVDVCEDGIA